MDELRYKDPDNSPENFEEADYGATQELMQNNRLFNRDLNAVHLMTTFPFMKKWEDISANEHSHEYDSGHHVSDFFLENWYVTKIAVAEKQMEQFIGDS